MEKEKYRIIIGERKIVTEGDRGFKVYIPPSIARELLRRGIERVIVELIVDEE